MHRRLIHYIDYHDSEHAMNSSRRSHTKTRTGCKLCKKRKIKVSRFWLGIGFILVFVTLSRCELRVYDLDCFAPTGRARLSGLTICSLSPQCDEQKPACNNCIRHSAQCDFMLTQSPAAFASPENQSAHIDDSSDNTPNAYGDAPSPHR